MTLPKDVFLEIVVVDDDVEQTGLKYIGDILEDKSDIKYLVSGESNVAKARNLAMQNAEGDWLFFLDDDEIVNERALLEMLKAADTYNADVVFGKVGSVYPDDAPEWIVKGDFFNRKFKETGTEVDSGGCGCTFVSKNAIDDLNITFNPLYGKTGGEDSDFFYRIKKAGRNLVYCNEAYAEELVEKNRLNACYILDRAYRVGQTYTRYRIVESGFSNEVAYFVKEFSKLIISMAMYQFYTFIRSEKAFRWNIKMFDIKGKLSILLGKDRQ